MGANRKTADRVVLLLAIAAAGAIHISIAASQILLLVAVVTFVVVHGKLYFPRIWIPLAIFFLWTGLADVLSPDPWGGRAQLKKFILFFFIPLIYGVFRDRMEHSGGLLAAWAAAATASGSLGLEQFARKLYHSRQTGEDFYVTYVGHRITGFESHWMTFGALQLSVLSLLLAHWFFARRRWPVWVYAGSVLVLFAAIVLGETRSIWLATIAATFYLVAVWRPRMLVLIPVIAAVTFAVSPAATQERFRSLIAPHGETDSNRHRYVTFRTGVEMVKAHPWFGLGPEQIRRQFDDYVPKDIPRPLPVGYYGHLHNIYVQYAAERGLPALAILVWLLTWTLRDYWRSIKRRTDELSALHGAVAVIIGVLVGGIFEHNLGDSEVLMMFASVLGWGYAAVYSAEHRRPEVEASHRGPAEFRSAESPALVPPLRS